MKTKLWGRFTIGAAIGVLIAATAAGPPATAATFTITTADDIVNGADGVLSLREAISLANAAGSATTIDVGVPGPLTLSICGVSDDDDNASGDLDLSGPQTLTLELGPVVIDQLCGGERHIHLLTDAGALTINGGIFTAGTGGFPGGASIFAGEATTLNGTEVNSSGSPGNAAVEVDTGAILTLEGATVSGNSGDAVGNTFAGSLALSNSTLANNGGSGVNMTDGHLTVTGSTVTNNGGYGVRTTGQGIGSMAVSDSSVNDNDNTGITCSNCGSLSVTNTTVANNGAASASGYGGIHVAIDLDPVSAITVTLDTVSVSGNSSALGGGGLAVTATTDNPEAPVPQIQVIDSTIAGNSTDDRGGAIFAELGAVTLANSTLSGNSSGAGAGSIESLAQPVHVQHATIVDGSGLFTDEIAAPALTGTTSIIGTVTDETVDCTTDAAPSLTHSLTGDASCGATVGDPALGALADNGGTTLTRLPSVSSDAGGLVPVASCTLTVDQRGTARPQGAACDAGAVEFAEITPTPTPTPSPTPTPPASECTISGTERGDVLFGTPADDVICGLGGADIIVAGRGADRVLGGPGADIVFGGPGDDNLRGDAGADTLFGEGGRDRADGGAGKDRCIAETRVRC